MKLSTLEDLLVHEMTDLYSAETQLVAALPKVAKAANSDMLKKAIENHLRQTEKQVERLEKCCEILGVKTNSKKCAAMEGLIEECNDLLKQKADPSVLDAAIIAGSQRIEHYDIAGYGAARTFAEQLGQQEIAELLQETLNEESATNEKLNRLALKQINPAAAQVG